MEGLISREGGGGGGGGGGAYKWNKKINISKQATAVLIEIHYFLN